MLTLAVVLLTYAVSEFLGGSGSLSSLLFGITLGNEKEIYQILRMKSPPNMVVDGGLKRFESEIAFLLRTFFFVFIGLIASISNVTVVFAGIILSFVLLLVRFGSVALVTIHSELLEERAIMSVTLTRGLAAAVLATLPLQYATPDAISKYGLPAEYFAKLSYLYVDVAVIVILTTAIIASVGVPLLKRKARYPCQKQ
ncbi:hypothetical protein A3K79_03860 [Candidatus Bathyarchaeota archaeon RBG_13_46_16b]|nr:MAG: hypothetical protein A3K79_03860 [Candidatus Bathyarchaeota archaeon RBG_13_46_16b]